MGEENRTMIDDDGGLVSRCRRGDTDAFEVLVERYRKKMLNVAYRMTGDYEDACEVAQEAFLSAYRAIKGFRGEAKFSTWLTGITVNHARNRLRQSRSRSHYEVFSLDAPQETESGNVVYDPPSGDVSAIDLMEQKEVRAKVRECVGNLDGEFREVLVLRDMEGFSYDEIRTILKIPDGTVKSRLYRARSSVKNCLKRAMGQI